MDRTQIYLLSSQRVALRQKAKINNSSLSEVIRRIITKELDAGKFSGDKQVEVLKPTLLEVAKEISKLGSKKGPRDLATNLDQYLYGDKQ